MTLLVTRRRFPGNYEWDDSFKLNMLLYKSLIFLSRNLARAAPNRSIFSRLRGFLEVILQSPALHLWWLIQEGGGSPTHFWLGGNCRDPFVFLGGSRTWQRLCLSWPRGPVSSTPFSHLITHAEPLQDRLGYLSEHTGTSVFNPLPPSLSWEQRNAIKAWTGADRLHRDLPASIPRRLSSKADV